MKVHTKVHTFLKAAKTHRPLSAFRIETLKAIQKLIHNKQPALLRFPPKARAFLSSCDPPEPPPAHYRRIPGLPSRRRMRVTAFSRTRPLTDCMALAAPAALPTSRQRSGDQPLSQAWAK